jgi:hypothetical protein
MKRWTLFIAMAPLFVASCGQKEAGGGEGSGSSGGDYIRSVFIEAKQRSVEAVYIADLALLEEETSDVVAKWIEQKKSDLVEDIATSKHVWVKEEMATCAETKRESKANIKLSFPSCKGTTDTVDKAAFVIIHESVHHFGIDDEDFADQVAYGILKSSVGTDVAVGSASSDATYDTIEDAEFETPNLPMVKFEPFANEERGICYYAVQEYEYKLDQEKIKSGQCEPYVEVVAQEDAREPQYFHKFKITKSQDGYHVFVANYEAWPYTQAECPVVNLKVRITGYCGDGVAEEEGTPQVEPPVPSEETQITP